MLFPTRWPKPPEVTRPVTSTLDADRLVAEGDRAGLVEDQAAEAPGRALVALLEKCVEAVEAARLVPLDGEAEAGLERGRLRA